MTALDIQTARVFKPLLPPACYKGAHVGRGSAKSHFSAGLLIEDSLAEKGKAGIDALGWYHEKRDATRNIGLGPEHDWASHGADAFGLMCVVYEQPTAKNDAQTQAALAKLRKYAR